VAPRGVGVALVPRRHPRRPARIRQSDQQFNHLPVPARGIDALAAAAPGLHGALLAARSAGHSHVSLDGTLIRTDRPKAAGPTAKVDLWWSGKHHHHGGNVQVVTAPDRWPLWTSSVRPGREHDVTCARTHPGLLDGLDRRVDAEHVVLADLGYLGEDTRMVCPIKKPSTPRKKMKLLSVEQRTVNAPHSATRALAERGNSLLKTTFKALRRVSFCRGGSARSPPPPWSCSTTSMTGRPDQLPTGKAQSIPRPRSSTPRRRSTGAPTASLRDGCATLHTPTTATSKAAGTRELGRCEPTPELVASRSHPTFTYREQPGTTPDDAQAPELSAQLSGTVRHHAAPSRDTDSESLARR